MKPLLTIQSSIEFDLLFKLFNQTHEPADLEKLLICCCEYPNIHRLTVMTLFLHGIREKKFIKQEPHTQLLYSFALQMISLISNKENKSYHPSNIESTLLTRQIKLFIHEMLEISRSYILSQPMWRSQEIFYPQREFDYLYWNSAHEPNPLHVFENFFFSLANLISNSLSITTDDEYLLLKLLIVGLYICLKYSDQLTIVSNLKLNTFAMLKFFHDDSRYRCLATLIDSKKIVQFLNKIPKIVHPGDLSIVNSLLSDNLLTYRIWGFPAKVTVPARSACGKVIRRMLHNKLIPMVLQHQSAVLNAITRSLPIISRVLVQLVYQYYNEIKFLNLKIVFDKQTARNQFELFYYPDKKPDSIPSLRKQPINDDFTWMANPGHGVL
jgi:hypothetical protein